MQTVVENLLDDSTLRNCMLFSELTNEERTALIVRAPTRTFAPGETVFLMGSRGNSMMVVLSGSVRISVSSADGKELTLAIVQKDEIFGEITLLDRKERTADATDDRMQAGHPGAARDHVVSVGPSLRFVQNRRYVVHSVAPNRSTHRG